MKVHVIGSSSHGNCYVFSNKKTKLIVECGKRFIDVKKALNFNIHGICGAIVTHEHGDHAKYISEYLNAGIHVLALSNIRDKQKNKHGIIELQPKKVYRFGDFKVFALEVHHDVPCVGYVIYHPEMGNVLFVTDTISFPYSLQGINHLFIEANYADDILLDNIEQGKVPYSMRDRLLNSHMELEETKRIVSDFNNIALNTVVLIHLSDGNSNADRFQREVKDIVPTCEVYVAEKGMEIDLNVNPY